MRLDRRFFVVLSVSLVWALIVSAMFYRMASGSGARRHVEQRKSLVVASRALPMGATVTRDSVQVREVPESFFPAGGFSKVEDVADRPVISPIQADEAVVDARLAAKGSGIGLAPLIPNGMRALSVRVNDVVGVSGFILPGMRVDVLVTGRPSGQNDTVTRTVLQNIAVLSAGQTMQADGKSQSMQVPVVTLLVSPQEAESLTLANSEGKVQLVLRNSADGGRAPTSGFRLHELYGSPAVPDAATAAVYRAPPPVRAAAESVVVPRPAPPALAPVQTAAQAPAKPAEDAIEVIHGKVKTIEVFARKGSSK